MTSLQECVEFLSREGYLLRQKDKYLLTAKFNREVTGQDIGVITVDRSAITVREKAVKPKRIIYVKGGVEIPEDKVNWVKLYQDFIIEVGIPDFGYSGNGDRYDMNRATKPGREAFVRAMGEGIQYDLLILAAKAYYSVGTYRKKIENYFVEELWRSDYGKTGLNPGKDDGLNARLGI